MGLISWIKRNYYGRKIKKAQRLYNNGDAESSIATLKKVLNKHTDAPSCLLTIYHDSLQRKEDAKERTSLIHEAADLYGAYNQLQGQCIDFLYQLKKADQPKRRLIIDYSAALCDKGLKELQQTFIDYSVTFVLDEQNKVDDLRSITTSPNLLNSLANALFTKADEFYKASHLNDCIRLCKLLLPHLTSRAFCSLLTNLCNFLTSRAKQSESNNDYDSAICDYSKVDQLQKDPQKDAKGRLYICKLKKGDKLSNTEILEAEKLSLTAPVKKDLAYRLCLYLLSVNKTDDAKRINKIIAGGDAEITQLCQNNKILEQQRILVNLNDKISKLNNSEVAADTALSWERIVSTEINQIVTIAKVPDSYANALKMSIRQYATEKYYDEGDYIRCFERLKMPDSSYLAQPVTLRNVAIVALLIAESGKLSHDNYKELLSIYATAVYQQKLFVDSLDYTSWDDPYTFTLSDAKGCLSMSDDDPLPDNVVKDPYSDDNVVSIREVQCALLSRMEAAINGNSEFESFWASQLSAMDRLVGQNLDKQCVLVAPYMLTLSRAYRDNVSRALSFEVDQNYGNKEDIIEIGDLYGLSNGIFGQYHSASIRLQEITSAIRNKSKIPQRNLSSGINEITCFSKLKSNLISTVTTAMKADESNNVDYAKFMSYYETVVKTINDDTLSYAFSNYVNQQVVSAVNNDRSKMASCAKVLFDLYSWCKCNPHLTQNVTSLLKMLVADYLAKGTCNCLDVLCEVLSNTREFDWKVKEAFDSPEITFLCMNNGERFSQLKSRLAVLCPSLKSSFDAIEIDMQLNNIVAGVNDDRIPKCNALESVYALYTANPNHVRICENLAQLVAMCVIEYVILNNQGRTNVKRVLDKLKSNMSQTFRSHNSAIEKQHGELWRSLSTENQRAITHGQNLNESGWSLKKGLEYLESFGACRKSIRNDFFPW